MRNLPLLRSVPGPRRQWRRLLPGLLLVPALLGPVMSSEADVALRRRVIAHFPDQSWCPFERGYDFSFVATTNKADLIFEALAGDLESAVEVDDVSVVGEDVFARGFQFWGNLECDWFEGAPYFKTESTTGFFNETFDSGAGWSLVNAEISGGILRLGVDPTSRTAARATVTGLVPGARYYVTGWSSWELFGEVTVKVDLPRPSEFLLQNGRFKLELRHDGPELAGGEVVSDRSAVFWFRDPLKTELIVNVVDRCQDKGTYFAQVGGTVATQASIVITDLQTGKKVSYKNKQGERFQTKIDQTTFRCK